MDGLSIALAVLSLAGTIKQLIDFAYECKNARTERKEVATAASSLLMLLHALYDFAPDWETESPRLLAARRLQAQPEGLLARYQSTLAQLAPKLEPGNGLRKHGKTLTWKFTREEIKPLLVQMNDLIAEIDLILSVDQTTLLLSLKQDMAEVKSTGSDTNLKITAGLDIQDKDAILQWLSADDPILQHQDLLQRKWEGTEKWIIQAREFRTWLHTGQSRDTLFCTGSPGAGKTTMASLAIEHLLQTSPHDWPVAFVYFNHQSKAIQTPVLVLRSMLRQIVQRSSGVPEAAKTLHEKYKNSKGTPELDEFKAILKAIGTQLAGLWMVADALDERDVQTQESLFSLLIFLRSLTNVRLLATSRFQLDTETSTNSLLNGAISLEVRTSDQDLETYVRSRLSDLDPDIYDEEDLPKRVVTCVVKAAQGMFLLARLFAKTMHADEILKSLENLPQTHEAYKEAYDYVMQRIRTQLNWQRCLAESTFSWLLCAVTPLTVTMLEHALATRLGSQASKPRLPRKKIDKVLIHCAGLVTVDQRSGLVRFTHSTVREYLQHHWKNWPLNANLLVARSCTAIIMSVASTPETEKLDNSLFAYAQYACANWPHHAGFVFDAKQDSSQEAVVSKASAEISDLLQNETALSFPMYYWYPWWEDRWPKPRFNVTKGVTAAHWAAKSASMPLLQWCIYLKLPLDGLMSHRKESPLHSAARNGSPEIIQCFIDLGVSSSARDYRGGTPLHHACLLKRENAAKTLLGAADIDVNAINDDGYSALHLAASKVSCTVVRHLLATNSIDTDLEDKRGRSVLFIALSAVTFPYVSHRGSNKARTETTRLVQVLHESGKVDFNARDENGRTPLIVAAHTRNAQLTDYLLNVVRVGNVNACDNEGCSAMFFAALQGAEEAVKVLIDAGADLRGLLAARTLYENSQGDSFSFFSFLTDGVYRQTSGGYDRRLITCSER